MERTIAVVNDVKDLSELLSGARVEQARLVPSGGRLRLEMELTRIYSELQTVERHGLLTRTKTPRFKSRLVLSQIKDAAVQRLTDAPPGETPLLSCEAIPGGYTLVVASSDWLRLLLTLEQLDGQFADGEVLHV